MLYEANNSESEKLFETAYDVLDEFFNGQILREIIKDIDVTLRKNFLISLTVGLILLR